MATSSEVGTIRSRDCEVRAGKCRMQSIINETDSSMMHTQHSPFPFLSNAGVHPYVQMRNETRLY